MNTLYRGGWMLVAVILAGGGIAAAASPLELVQTVRDGANGITGLAGAAGIAVSPDGRHVYAAARSGNALHVFSRNPNTGSLTFVQRLQHGDTELLNLFVVQGVAISADGNHVYTAAILGRAVTVFARDRVTGLLTPLQVLRDGVPGLDRVVGVTVAPNGRHVYAVSTQDDAIVTFSRDTTTGLLTHVNTLVDDANGIDGLADAFAVVVSPDNNHVYVAGSLDDAIAVFARDPTTGFLTQTQVVRNGAGGVQGLDEVSSVALSPNGTHLYAASYQSSTLSVFARNSTTGALTFLDVLADSQSGGEGLAGAHAVAVSPDGADVYSAALVDSAVSSFERDAASGLLTLGTTLFDDEQGANGLSGAWYLAVSPDSRHVYVSAIEDGAISVFFTGKELPGLLGDINRDGFVNAVDVQLVINAALGIPVDPAFVADINGDTSVNAVDVQLVINAALGVA